MNKLLYTFVAVSLLAVKCAAGLPEEGNFRTLTPSALKDKIAGGWAGKMIGVTYGAPTEFHACGRTFEQPITWTPADIRGSLWQDDLYVQLTFLMTMEKFGIHAPARIFHEMFARAGYPLWHANVQSRKNYYDGIAPPASGHPDNNFHADDIDFQIEADYIGFMCPGMPRTAAVLADTIGHIMNYGDGVYGGMFVAALYAEAFFENDVETLIRTALKSIPAESDYAKVVRDVLVLWKHNPDNWRAAWKELEAKWGAVDICGAGSPFNIDAKLNGAYIVMGLVYGGGDPMKTLEVSARCGQDSDCNPSSALAVVGVMKGFSALPEVMRNGVAAIGDSLFINTTFSFNRAVDVTSAYALELIKKEGGTIQQGTVSVKVQQPAPPPLETAFPNAVFVRKVSVFDSAGWHFTGSWRVHQIVPEGETAPRNQSMAAGAAGDAAELTFTGTGISLTGNWFRDCGQADVYLDGTLKRTIDSYFFYNNQEQDRVSLWHAFNLPPGTHTVKLVVKGEKRRESQGNRIYLVNALVFETGPKKNEGFKFSFEK